jgi:paraquat-inducible protein A
LHPVSHQHPPTYTHDATACEECDLLVPATELAVGDEQLSALRPYPDSSSAGAGAQAHRLRLCGHHHVRALQRLYLHVVLGQGVGQETFLQCITTLVDQGYLFLGAVLSLT